MIQIDSELGLGLGLPRDETGRFTSQHLHSFLNLLNRLNYPGIRHGSQHIGILQLKATIIRSQNVSNVICDQNDTQSNGARESNICKVNKKIVNKCDRARAF
jgi:hypothetical protein